MGLKFQYNYLSVVEFPALRFKGIFWSLMLFCTYVPLALLYCYAIGNEALVLREHQLLVKLNQQTNNCAFVTEAQVQMHKDQIMKKKNNLV